MGSRGIYPVFINGSYRMVRFAMLLRLLRSQTPSPFLWSARLSTGLLGLRRCPAGNRGPKASNEILLAVGDDGLRKLIDLGFIPCPVCHPEHEEGFWDVVKGTVESKYGITSLDHFIDKAVLPFDARRVNWEEILPVVGQWPGRLYVPKGLQKTELAALQSRIEQIGYGFPSVGYYDEEAPERFTLYDIPSSAAR